MYCFGQLQPRLLWGLFGVKLGREDAIAMDQMKSRRPDNTAAVIDIPVDALGIEPRLKKLQSYLIGAHQACSTIAICGPGGSGKTTLLKALNNKLLSSEHDFQMVIFAPVSRDSSIERLQAVIAKRLGLPWLESENREIKAVRIAMALENKRFLLLLDGLREPLDLDDIGIPNSKVMFTTRSRQVCTKMGADEVFKVDPLDPHVAWQLFQSFAGEEASRPEIIEVAKNLASQCEGLPLGLMTVGRSMASVATKEEWMESLATLQQLKQDYFGMPEESSTLLSQFCFSYKKLHTQQLRDCLLYCSLFPKNHSIKQEDLVRYWMGEGLLEEYGSIAQVRREGDKLIGELKTLGMLEDGDNPNSEVVMHDILCDLALLIKKNEFLVGAGLELIKVPEVLSFKETEKVSLMNNHIQVLDQLPTFPHLTTLILRRNPSLRRVEDRNLFDSSSSLRLLDLSDTRIRSIPSEVGRLVFLRHLDLSFTKIKVLPREIGNLVNLVQLLLEGTNSLARIPADVISKLSKVRVLNMYGSFGDWELKDCQDSRRVSYQEGQGKPEVLQFTGINIEELECLQQLNDLGITICNTPAFRRFRRSSRLTKSTGRLSVKGCGDLESVNLSSSSFENLREVTISDCCVLKELMIGGSGDDTNGGRDWRLLHLEVLRLKGLYQAEIIWNMGKISSSDCIPMLRELDISFCHELRNVSWVLKLGCLERINLDTCNKIEHVVEQGLGKLPRLKTLILRNLPQLKSISRSLVSFPSLESVKVLRCPQLSIPRMGAGGIRSVFIQGEKEWWNALEWKDELASFWHFQAAEGALA